MGTVGEEDYKAVNPRPSGGLVSWLIDVVEKIVVKSLYADSTKPLHYLLGNFAPVEEETDPNPHLTIVGNLPQCLNGEFARVGPNPKFTPVAGYHWFDGDGSVSNLFPQSFTDKFKFETKEAEEAKFSPFTGVARRLDGKPLKYSVAPITSSGSSDAAKNKSSGSGPPSSVPQRRPSGKLVFGSGVGSNPVDEPKSSVKEIKQDAPKEEPKFQAFTGKKYSLKD